MKRLKRGVALLPVLMLVALPTLAATAREMYAAAMAREKALHEAVDGSGATVTLKQFRAAITAFENVVRRHPTAGYSDNALWEGAKLAAEAHQRFGDDRAQATSIRLLTWLVKEYPASPLMEKAREELKRTSRPPAERAVSSSRRETTAPGLPTPRPTTPTVTKADELRPGAPAVPTADPSSPSDPGTVVLRDIRRTVVGDVVRVTIQLDAEVTYRTERIENPSRVLFDLAGTRLGPAVLEGSLSYSGDIVRHVRVGRHPNQVTRVVLDLDGVKRYSVFTLYSPYRIVVDCERDRAVATPLPRVKIAEEKVTLPPPDPEPIAVPELPVRIPARVTTRTLAPTVLAPPSVVLSLPVVQAAPLRPSRVVKPTGRSAWQPTVRMPAPIVLPPSVVPPAAESRASGQAKLAEKRAASPAVPLESAERATGRTEKIDPPGEKGEKSVAATDRPVTPSTPIAVPPNGFSLARQLGLGASRIVIDPGHGGHDPGAEGPGVFEAHVVLDVALRLEKLLVAAGSEVVLTRRTDEYVQLEERTAIANRAQGDLFLSIHANASRNRAARGVESYFLNFATNPDAEAVAARENAATGRTMSSLTEIVKAITLNNKLDESKNFAGLVQRQMVEHLKGSNRALKNHGVKQAPFVVLIGASMPSVLVEVSFITNSQEGRLLKTGPYRQKVAEALFDAIRGYQKSLKGATALANQ